MKIITMYELLGMVKDGKAPKKIKINNVIYEYKNFTYCTENADYQDIEDYLFGKWNFNILNDEVEIIEEEPRDIEVCGSLFTKSEYDKLAHCEEEKKIPEKIKDKYCSQISKVELAQKYNEIIDYLDYLKSKGE